MERCERVEMRSLARAVAYVRVGMARDGMISPELRMTAINEYCKRCGYRIVEVLKDLDLSGRFWQRRQVDQARGYGEKQAEDDLHELGVRHVVIPRKGGPSQTRQAEE